jgi:hypothetical protein
MGKQHKVGFAVIAGTLAVFAFFAYGQFGIQMLAPPASLADPNSPAETEVHKPSANGTVHQPVILQANTSDFDSYSPSPLRAQQGFSPYDERPAKGFMDSPVPADGQRPSLLPDPLSLERDGAYQYDAPARPASDSKFDPRDDESSSLPKPLYDVRPAGNVEDQPTLLPSPRDLNLQPIDAEARTQTVRPNDSFWLISERAYGSSVFYKALYQHNRDLFPQPDRLPPGTEVDVPPLNELRGLYPELCPLR